MTNSPTPITIAIDDDPKRIDEVVLAYRMEGEPHEVASVPTPAIGELRRPDDR